MNKDVIYIEPEDDITDVILKIENSKEKIVALVPPKKAGIFRSVVNIKLIAKAGASSEKTVVLVTVDPSIVKLAAATKLPVAKNLQTAPVIPKLDAEEDEENEPEEDELVEDDTDEVEDEKASNKGSKSTKKDSTEDEDEDEDEEEEEEDEKEEEEIKEKPKKSKKDKKAHKHKFTDWIKVHKKLSIFGGVCILGLIGFLVWAFVFAPAVDILVAIKTEQKNFSENITFTDNINDENAEEGKFYLEQKTIESTQEVNFEATGQKNQGERASGEVIISAIFDAPGATAINPGTLFTYNGLSYAANEYKALSWDGDEDSCENDKKIQGGKIRCLISEKVSVTATEGGSKYNVAAASTGWSTVASINVYSKTGMSGGTDDTITVVQQSDVEKAKSEITASKEEENRTKLYETIDDNYYIIESSFEQNTSSAVATPGVDEKVDASTKPSIKVTTTISVYVIDKIKLEKFINNKAELGDDQKIYDIKDVYIDNPSRIAVNSTVKLKAQYFIGPKLTEAELVDKIKGRGLGDARREISDIYGVSEVTMNPSYPWVFAVPGDSNKIQIRFEVKDQDGNEIKTDEQEETADEGNEQTEEKQEETKE